MNSLRAIFPGRNFNRSFIPERVISLILVFRFFNSRDVGFRGHDLVDAFNEILKLKIGLVKGMINLLVEILECYLGLVLFLSSENNATIFGRIFFLHKVFFQSNLHFSISN
jgi:hypothetical protein